MKHLSKRYRALGSAYNLLPTCGTCNEKLDEDNSYTAMCFDCIKENPTKYGDSNYSNPIFACQKCIQKAFNFNCILCRKQLDTNPSPVIKAIHNFIKVFCYKHKNIIAEFFNEESLLTFCLECKNNYRKKCCDLNHYDLYHNLENLFKEKFNNYRKMIPPERRKQLIPYTTQELLEACRYFSRITSLKCEEHFENANEINISLNLYCSKCEKPQERLININEKPEIKRILIENLKNFARANKSKYLNKLTLSILLAEGIGANNNSFEVALEEIKKLSCNTKETYPERCAICKKCISEGVRKGINGNCIHTMCFECIYIKHLDKCPIDHIDIIPKKQVNKKFIDRIYCHRMHFITGKAIKLPCTHMSCQVCLTTGKCLRCLFDLDFFKKEVKEYKKSSDLADFYLIKCPIHSENIEWFLINPIALYCLKCKQNCITSEQERLISLSENSKNTDYKFMMKKLDEIIQKYIGLAKENIKTPPEIIKSMQYYNIMDYNNRYNFYRLLLSFGDNSIKNTESEEFIRFSKIFTYTLNSKKILKIEEDEVIGVNINVSEDVYLDGLIILGKYIMNVAEYKSTPFSVDWIRIIRNHNDGVENENEGFWQNYKLMPYKSTDVIAYGLYDDEINKVYFNGRIRLSPHLNYDIIIKLSPGDYHHGVPYCRVSHEIFTVKRVKNIDKGFVEKGNTSIGGPLYGFMFTRCKGRII